MCSGRILIRNDMPQVQCFWCWRSFNVLDLLSEPFR
jgi:hypothetical protein